MHDVSLLSSPPLILEAGGTHAIMCLQLISGNWNHRSLHLALQTIGTSTPVNLKWHICISWAQFLLDIAQNLVNKSRCWHHLALALLYCIIYCHPEKSCLVPGGGHWPRKRVWGCAALKNPFLRLSCCSQGSHFKQKSQLTRPPFEKIWKF